MSGRAVAFESVMTGERLEVDTPLQCSHDLAQLRAELGLPDFVDLGEPHVGRAVAVLWAANRARDLAASEPRLHRVQRPIRVATFGGVAFRFLSPTANRPGIARSLGDLDLISLGADGDNLVLLLTCLADLIGNRYWHAVTKSDEMFNNLRAGQRYRVHALEQNGEEIVSTSLDIFVDRLRFCHDIELKSALEASPQRFHTIGAAELLVTKLQYIRAVSPSELPDEARYRVIGSFGKQLLIGPEDKDLWDVACLLGDAATAPSAEIDEDAIAAQLRSDWALARTIALNTANAGAIEHVLEHRAVEPTLRARALAQLARLAELSQEAIKNTRTPRFRLSKRWWEEVEDL